MSTTQHTSTATCTLNVSNVNEAVQLYLDWLTNNPDEIPDELEEYEADDTKAEVEKYIRMDKDGQIIVSVDTEESNSNSEVFDSICNHFQTIQTSEYMTVNWSCYDSKDGVSCGTQYYDQNGQYFDMIDKSKDGKALNAIAEILSGKSWDVDMLMSISDIVTSTGRIIKDVEA